MGFFGGPSKQEKRAQESATRTAESRFGDIYGGAMGGADYWGGRSRGRAGTMDTRADEMWGMLGEGGRFSGSGGVGAGGGPGYRGDPNSLWGQLRDTGDLTPGDWEASRGVYRDYMDTGGWDEDRQGNFRARALAGTDVYDPSEEARSRVQGGWGAGAGGDSLARLKETARARHAGMFGAETEMQRAIDEGRKWGATSSEGLGAKVQAGRITGQQQMDAERQRRHSAARARHASSRASMDQEWARRMQLQEQGYGNIGRTGGDLPYYGAAGGAAGAALQGRQSSFGQQQQNRGWGAQLGGMLGGAARSASGINWGGGGRAPMTMPEPGSPALNWRG